MIVQANIREHHWKAPGGRTGSFTPNGKIVLVGNKELANQNPATWESDEPLLAARLFVGFNVGGTPTWKLNDLVRLVEEIRTRQGHHPDSSFLAQKGIYTSRKTGKTIEEDSGQIILLNTDGIPQKAWEKEMVDMAEEIARTMDQEEVIVEIQQGGITKKTFGVIP